jgi:CNT family concentrative nucleoside transporter
MERIISLVGLFAMMGMAWALSTHRKQVNLRIVAGGVLLQFVLALLILKTSPGHSLFAWLGDAFRNMQQFTDAGTMLIFGVFPQPGDEGLPPPFTVIRTLAFGVLPTIIVFSSLMSVLYYLGLIQLLVRGLAKVMQATLGTSGAETLAAAANVFVGQTEAPLVVKPYLAKMTDSELMAMMVGGFATIAGGVMAVYASMGVDPGHLMTASVISAPAGLVIAKLMIPETETPETAGGAVPNIEHSGNNVIEAATMGASDGLKLALNVAAMLIAFTALVAMLDALIGWTGSQFGQAWTLGAFMGYVFYPIALLMGVASEEALHVGELLGLKMVANEFLAYQRMSEWLKPDSGVELSERTQVILTYALAGFANLASIGIQIGGIGALVPERRPDLARLGFKAMIGGTLACFMTACIAGVLL